MDSNEQFKTLQVAISYGGGFIQKLAEAALHADPANKALIFKTWPVLEMTYGPNSALYLNWNK